LTRQQIETAMNALTGEIEQVPPVYSAKKVAGERMHRLARRGQAVAVEPVKVTVTRFDLTGIDLPNIEFEAECSSGTYIRALARDLGRALGTGGHLVALRRTRIGTFNLKNAVTTDQLAQPDALQRAALTPLEAMAHLPRVDVDADAAARLRQGKALSAADAGGDGTIVLASNGELVALARARDGLYRPFKVWAANDE
jgi:tRNA pseudouridine55 synthase